MALELDFWTRLEKWNPMHLISFSAGSSGILHFFTLQFRRTGSGNIFISPSSKHWQVFSHDPLVKNTELIPVVSWGQYSCQSGTGVLTSPPSVVYQYFNILRTEYLPALISLVCIILGKQSPGHVLYISMSFPVLWIWSNARNVAKQERRYCFNWIRMRLNGLSNKKW